MNNSVTERVFGGGDNNRVRMPPRVDLRGGNGPSFDGQRRMNNQGYMQGPPRSGDLPSRGGMRRGGPAGLMREPLSLRD